MRQFATRDEAVFTKLADLFSRLMMCVVPAAAFKPGEFAFSAALALFVGAADGVARRWGSCSSHSLLAESQGLTISGGGKTRLVPWERVLAIQTWHHYNQIDYVAVHYRRSGRIEVATCLDWYGQDDLGAFVRACADGVSAHSPRTDITLAGLRDPGIYMPLVRRFTQDTALATLAGCLFATAGAAIGLGLLAASLSALVAALRHPLRTTMLVQQNGLWCFRGSQAAPPRTIPRPLRLWVRSLADAAYDGPCPSDPVTSSGPNQPALDR